MGFQPSGVVHQNKGNALKLQCSLEKWWTNIKLERYCAISNPSPRPLACSISWDRNQWFWCPHVRKTPWNVRPLLGTSRSRCAAGCACAEWDTDSPGLIPLYITCSKSNGNLENDFENGEQRAQKTCQSWYQAHGVHLGRPAKTARNCGGLCSDRANNDSLQWNGKALY